MKRLTLTTVILLLVGCSPLTPKEQILFGTMLAAHAADYETTRRGVSQGMVELNPILGSRPDQGNIALFKLGAVGVIYGLGELFPEHREFIYTLGIFTGGAAVINNEMAIKW